MGMKLLVTGGAGYVGSVVAAELLARGHKVTILDDLSTGHRDAVPEGAVFVEGDVRTDSAAVLALGRCDGILHFAGKSLVGESMKEPATYWETNLDGSLALARAAIAAGVPRFVFSSTAATYGQPLSTPIYETAPTRPTSPYGSSKLAVDQLLTGFCAAHGLGAVSLRYFNVGGAVWRFGERHRVETHLVPLILEVAAGKRPFLEIYGDDWPTPDGTCVRDYIHVADLAEAHALALSACSAGEHKIFNLGTGTGYSVREVVRAAEMVVGRPIPVRVTDRRPGDPSVLVAGADAARRVLGWRPSRDLHDIVSDAWKFAQRADA